MYDMSSSRDALERVATLRMASSPVPEDEALLVAGALAGNVGALAALYEAHGAAVFSAALRLLRDTHDAEDVTHELFARLTITLTTYDPRRGALGPWLRRVAVRLALMRLRATHRRREVGVGDVAALLAPHDAAAERIDIEGAIARLSAEHRTVFVLKEIEGYSHSEIASLLGISIAASEVSLYRARVALRAFLGSSR